MKQLSKLQRIILAIGALMMVAGAIVYVAVDSLHAIFSFIFLIGACLYTAMQCQQTYSGNNIAIRRLCRQMIISDIFLILAGPTTQISVRIPRFFNICFQVCT